MDWPADRRDDVAGKFLYLLTMFERWRDGEATPRRRMEVSVEARSGGKSQMLIPITVTCDPERNLSSYG